MRSWHCNIGMPGLYCNLILLNHVTTLYVLKLLTSITCKGDRIQHCIHGARILETWHNSDFSWYCEVVLSLHIKLPFLSDVTMLWLNCLIIFPWRSNIFQHCYTSVSTSVIVVPCNSDTVTLLYLGSMTQ